MPALVLTVERGMYGMLAKPLVGALWRASFYDAERGQFYAGSADDPFEAIAWALFEREERIANHEHPTPTKASNETPVQALARLRTRTVCANLFPFSGPTAGTVRSPATASARTSASAAAGKSASRIDELGRLGALNHVITSDLPTRHDGLPYANGRADDVGIAVWFVLPDRHGNMQERVFACDKWRSHAENMQAIAKSIEAMRGLDRWGAGDIVARAFSGFAALPPGVPLGPAKRPWREVLGLHPGEYILANVKLAHRELIRRHHPDAGGDHETAAELNAALAEAEAELGRARG